MVVRIKYGPRIGPDKGRELPVAASQYIHRRGGKFVYLSSGDVNMCATGTIRAAGWAEGHKHADGKNCWKSSGTAGVDTVFVQDSIDAIYELPYNSDNASLTATLVGVGVGLINGGVNATYGFIQEAKAGSTASPVVIVDIDKAAGTVFCKINPIRKQGI